MLAKTTYDATAVGGVGTMTLAGLVSVGSGPDESGYERFAAEVTSLEALEREGKVRIDDRHRESTTGHRHIDMVRFIRLK